MIQFIAETGSTNADLLARLKAGEGVREGQWLVADRQVAGRGRQGRPWQDHIGNFMGSTVVECRPADPPAQMLAFVTGLAVRGTLADWNALEGELRLKWPNDVLLNGAKLAGILLEREGDHVVVGIGVNLARAPRIEGRETIALADLGMQVPRDDFAHRLAERFAQELDRWRTFGTAHLLSQWSKAALAVGTPITVHEPGGAVLRGTVSGLGEDGSLLLDLGNGESRAIHAGDVMLARQ